MQPERILKALAITYGIYLLFALVIAMITSIGNLESFYTVMFIIAILPFAAIIENPITILFDVAAVFLAYCIVWTFENHRGESRYYPAAFLNKWNNLVTKLLVNKLHINKWTLTAVFSLLTVLIIGISLITPLAYVSIKYGYSSFIVTEFQSFQALLSA